MIYIKDSQSNRPTCLGNPSRTPEEDPGRAEQASELGGAAGAVSVCPPVWPRLWASAGAQSAAAATVSAQCRLGAQSRYEMELILTNF